LANCRLTDRSVRWKVRSRSAGVCGRARGSVGVWGVDPSRATDAWSSGDSYEPYVGRWSRLVAERFVGWLGIPPGGRWLDVGCGTGALPQAILSQAAPSSVFGLDPSPAYVEYAAGHTRDERARFEVGDAQQLSAGDGSFDVIVSGLVLNFVPDRHRALHEMRRVARHDGVVAAYVWDYPGEMGLMKHFWDTAVALNPAARELHEGVRFAFCQADALQAMFVKVGLTGVKTRAIVVPTVFADFDDYWSPFLGGQAPAPSYVTSLSEEDRLALREALRARLPISADGSIQLTARAWAVRARK